MGRRIHARIPGTRRQAPGYRACGASGDGGAVLEGATGRLFRGSFRGHMPRKAGTAPLTQRRQRIDKWRTLPRGCRKGRQAPSYFIRSGGVYAARSGCKPLPLSCSARALRAQEHDVPFAARLRNSLAAKDRRQGFVDGLTAPLTQRRPAYRE